MLALRFGKGLALALAISFAVAALPGARAEEPRRLGSIVVASSVDENELAWLRYDRAVLEALPITREGNPGLAELLGTKSLTPAALSAWLEERIQVIVGTSFDAYSHRMPLQEGFDYPNARAHAELEIPTYKAHGALGAALAAAAAGAGAGGHASSGDWDMANLASSFYEVCKSNGNLWGIEVPGVGIVPLSSPRAGLIQLGPSLFTPSGKLQGFGRESLPNVIYRLETFFHEARHGDGNGKSAGFTHAVCPPGHALAGRDSCDRNLNGPYTVGASVMKALTEQGCRSCSVAEREAMRLVYLDFAGRVLPTELDGKTPTRAWDATPEGTRMKLVQSPF